MTVSSSDLEAVLERAAPPALKGRVPTLARIVADLANGGTTPEAAKDALAAEAELIEALVGAKAVSVGRAVVDFKGAIAGSVNVGDVAGGDIFNITVAASPAASVQIVEKTPRHHVEGQLAGLLKGADVGLYKEAGEILGVVLSGTEEDMRWVLARRLLETDLETLVSAVTALSSQLCERAGAVVTVAAPFACIDQAAVALVRDAVPSRRGLGVKSARTETGRMVTGAACWAPPMWGVQEVPGGWGPDLADLEQRVASAVEEALGFPPEDLDEELSALPVVLVFPPPVPTAADLQAIRAKGYAKVSFLFLTGEMTRPEFAALALPDVDYVVPELDPAREAAYWRDINRALRDAKRACGAGRT